MSRSFGSYEVVALVAEGSTATVYRARHVELDRDAAIKELSPALHDVPGLIERMRAEAETLAGLDDEHIVRVYEFVEEPDRVWIAEQWVEGAPLDAILAARGSMTPEQSVGVIRGALMGLTHAHGKGLVHRDVAPTNILADRAGTSMLVDFGLAAPVGGTTALGTPAYMSPEAARGEPTTKQSDVYSAAAVLFALLTGRPPFPGADAATVVRQHAQAPAPSLEGHGPELRSVLTRAMDKSAVNRPADAAAFLAELERAAEARFGAGWLARASIASLVATTAAGTATAAGVAAGGSAATGAAPTVVVDAAAMSSGGGGGTATAVATSAPRKLLGLGVKQAVAASVATVVVVGAAIVGANAYSEHQDQVKADKAAAKILAAKKAEAAKVKAFADAAPDGPWTLTSTIISSEFDGEKPGQKDTFTWTFDSTCAGYSCSGGISSSSGRQYKYTWNGKILTVSPPAKLVQKETCVDPVTGQETPGSSATATFVLSYTPFVADATAGAATTLTGTNQVTKSFSNYVNCDKTDPLKSKNKFVLTKKG
jgi:tRNA A-37 threonylcarbamoyl transferase component Bud32